MKRRRFRVVVEWQDGDVEDCDEISVVATNGAGATSVARKKWRQLIEKKYPDCRSKRLFVLTPERRRGLD
jgi:hypothetical protein